MRILLDANIPKKLKAAIVGHEVWTARERNFNKLPDGQLLDAMGTDFDALVTMDKSLPFQQLLADRPFSVIVLRGNAADDKPLEERRTDGRNCPCTAHTRALRFLAFHEV